MRGDSAATGWLLRMCVRVFFSNERLYPPPPRQELSLRPHFKGIFREVLWVPFFRVWTGMANKWEQSEKENGPAVRRACTTQHKPEHPPAHSARRVLLRSSSLHCEPPLCQPLATRPARRWT